MGESSAGGSADLTWQERAACREVDAELFFTGNDGKHSRKKQVKEAKAVCHRCPVKTECLVWALRTQQRYGVLGGMSESERKALLRKQAREAKRDAPVEQLDGRDETVIAMLVDGAYIPGASRVDRAHAAVRVHARRPELSWREISHVVGATRYQVRSWIQRADKGLHPVGVQWLERDLIRRSSVELAEAS